MFPIEKYKFYQAGNKVIAVSSYGGRIVKGVAKTDPRDEFNLDSGKELAAARCNLKVAKKRKDNAMRRFLLAQEKLVQARLECENMANYLNDATEELAVAQNAVDDCLAKL